MKKTVILAAMFISGAVFADAADDFSKTPWSTWNSKDTVVKATINKTEGAAAKGALQLVYPKGTNGGMLKNFPVEPNTFYTAEIMIKTADADAITDLAVHDFGADNKYKKIILRKSFTPSTEWKKISVCFLTGSNTKFVRVLPGIMTKTAVPAFFDDFKLTKASAISKNFNVWRGEKCA